MTAEINTSLRHRRFERDAPKMMAAVFEELDRLPETLADATPEEIAAAREILVQRVKDVFAKLRS